MFAGVGMVVRDPGVVDGRMLISRGAEYGWWMICACFVSYCACAIPTSPFFSVHLCLSFFYNVRERKWSSIHYIIAVYSTAHERFYIIVHSQLVLVKFFEAGGLAQPHTTD